jgi:hypothetical protein
MTNTKRQLLTGILVAIGAVFLLPDATIGQGQSGTHTLTCGPDKTIAQAIKTLKPGDTLLVSGTCNENVLIGQEVDRITLDGQGTAAIRADSSTNAVTILGRGVTLRGFHITGGAPQGVAVNDGGSAVIDGNTIEFADRNGVAVFRNSSADILNNVIQNNPLAGIAVQYNSSARVGWFGPPTNRVSAPNTIQNNGTQGIQVYRGSVAQIFTNIIQNNTSHGVFLDRNAEAEVGANAFGGNGGDAIRAMRGSVLDIGTDVTHSTPAFDDDPNTGSSAGYAVSCMIGGVVDGRFGALTGTLGLKLFTEGCIDSSQQ